MIIKVIIKHILKDQKQLRECVTMYKQHTIVEFNFVSETLNLVMDINTPITMRIPFSKPFTICNGRICYMFNYYKINNQLVSNINSIAASIYRSSHPSKTNKPDSKIK